MGPPSFAMQFRRSDAHACNKSNPPTTIRREYAACNVRAAVCLFGPPPRQYYRRSRRPSHPHHPRDSQRAPLRLSKVQDHADWARPAVPDHSHDAPPLSTANRPAGNAPHLRRTDGPTPASGRDRSSLSRRGLKAPWVRVTRSTRWTEDLNPWKEPHRLPLLSGGLLAELILRRRTAYLRRSTDAAARRSDGGIPGGFPLRDDRHPVV